MDLVAGLPVAGRHEAFSGVLPTVEVLRVEGARVTVHDPMYTDEELCSLGFEPHTPGSAVDLAVLQSDHAEYAVTNLGTSCSILAETLRQVRRLVVADEMQKLARPAGNFSPRCNHGPA